MEIETTALSSEAFAPFGKVLASPLPQSTSSIPDKPPPNAVYANQGTALKYPEISPMTSTYGLSQSGLPAHPTMSLFSCFPRQLRTSNGHQIFDVRILERHPFTTQTFTPLSAVKTKSTKAVVIVAPTLNHPPPSSSLAPYFPHSKQGGGPDLQNLKAFVAEAGMGVTYGVGTWHAPMVVVGEERIDFVVTQWVNGRNGEDCQEVTLSEGVEVVMNPEKETTKEKAKL